MEILVSIKTVYGREKIYPVCTHAKLFTDIAGTTTLTREKINLIKKLGYEIKIQNQEHDI